ncbi:MAG: imelysin family protein [Aliarcobacter sp.]|nr:imelysin family protein [Aliarcobacter sp.]
MMKKVLFLLVLFSSLVFANERILLNVIKNVSIPNVQNTIENARILQQDLNTQNFTNFLQSWKKVEALYFAGDLNEDFLDTPRYIDIFNNLKEDLNSQMKMVIESKDDAKTALFKNSFKTINALEYMIFNDNEISKREKELSIVILNSMISHLEEIKTVYETYLLKPTKDEKWENALVINTLIASSYRLKEWRIGNASGNSSKFKNDVKNERAEYFLSQNSFNAIDAILEAHNQIVKKNQYYDFAAFVMDKGAAIELLVVIDKIKEMQDELKVLPKDDFTKANKLFNSAKDLHNAYYVSLIEQLSITGKILDADGD